MILYEEMLRKEVGDDLCFFDTIDSTNTYAKKLNHWQHGQLIVAKEQTAGRGTFGKSFISKANRGIFMTVVIDEVKWPFKFSHLNTHLIALLVRNAIKKITNLSTHIKWINDLFYDYKKVAGVLVERDVLTNKLVIGIGINISKAKDHFDGDLHTKATYLPLGENDEELAAKLVIDLYQEILRPPLYLSEFDLLTLYKEHMFLMGKTITLKQKTIEKTGKVIDVDDVGRLVLNVDGVNETFVAGEVTILL